MSCSTHTFTASLQRCGGVPLPTPYPILTTICSFLVFSPRDRAQFRISIDSFLPAASGWAPGMASISRDARSQYSRAVIGVFAAAFGTQRYVLVTTVSLYVAVVARIGNGAVHTSRREFGAGTFEISAQFFPCPQPDGRSFVAFRQSVCEGVSPSTVSTAILLHDPDDVQALISRHYIMYHDVPNVCDCLRYPGRI